MGSKLKLAAYMFLLGFGTYLFWKFTSGIKREIDKEEGR